MTKYIENVQNDWRLSPSQTNKSKEQRIILLKRAYRGFEKIIAYSPKEPAFLGLFFILLQPEQRVKI